MQVAYQAKWEAEADERRAREEAEAEAARLAALQPKPPQPPAPGSQPVGGRPAAMYEYKRYLEEREKAEKEGKDVGARPLTADEFKERMDAQAAAWNGTLQNDPNWMGSGMAPPCVCKEGQDFATQFDFRGPQCKAMNLPKEGCEQYAYFQHPVNVINSLKTYKINTQLIKDMSG